MHLSRNIRLVFRELAKGGLITLVVIAIVAGLNAAILAQRGDFSGVDITVAVVGIAAAILFLKAGFQFAFHRLLSKEPFEGSFLIAALLASIFLAIPLGAASFIFRSRVEGFPAAEAPFLIVAAYLFVSLALFLAFRLSHWFFGLFGNKGSTAR